MPGRHNLQPEKNQFFLQGRVSRGGGGNFNRTPYFKPRESKLDSIRLRSVEIKIFDNRASQGEEGGIFPRRHITNQATGQTP